MDTPLLEADVIDPAIRVFAAIWLAFAAAAVALGVAALLKAARRALQRRMKKT